MKKKNIRGNLGGFSDARLCANYNLRYSMWIYVGEILIPTLLEISFLDKLLPWDMGEAGIYMHFPKPRAQVYK